MTGIAWSVTCHYTLGVPYDALVRAHQKGGKSADDAEVMAEIQIGRMTETLRGSIPLLTGVVGFLLGMVATFGFFYDYELAQAVFMLAGPLILVQAIGARLAFKIEREGITGEALRKALIRRRFWNQVIGLVAIFFAAGVAFVSFVPDVVIWY